MEKQDYKYMVCTQCMTYNHAPYIEDALRGFAMQETTFPVVFTIIDDASIDGEPDVLRKWVGENLDFEEGTGAWKDMPYGQLTVANLKGKPLSTFVILLLHENHYSTRKSKMPYISEWNDHAKYIAICEGDDYWIEPKKLQKQVDYLDCHKECGIVYSKAKRWNEERQEYGSNVGHKTSGLKGLIRKNVVPTLTVLYRRDLAVGYKKVIDGNSWLMGDYPLWLYLSSKSNIHFFNEIFAVYREHSESATHIDDIEVREKFIGSIKDIQLFFCKLTDLDSSFVDDVYYNNLFYNAVYFKNYERAFSYYKKIRHPSFTTFLSFLKNKVKSIFLNV